MNRMINLIAASIGATLLTVPTLAPADSVPNSQPIHTAIAAGAADLVIQKVKRSPLGNRRLRVQVKNVGSAGAGANNMKLFYHRNGDVSVWGTTVPSLGKGESTWVTATAGSPIFLAEHVYLRVDDPNRVTELSEGNNSYVYK